MGVGVELVMTWMSMELSLLGSVAGGRAVVWADEAAAASGLPVYPCFGRKMNVDGRDGMAVVRRGCGVGGRLYFGGMRRGTAGRGGVAGRSCCVVGGLVAGSA